MRIEEIATIINETITESKEELEATGHIIESVIGIALQVMSALQRINYPSVQSRGVGSAIEDELKAKALNRILTQGQQLKDEENRDLMF